MAELSPGASWHTPQGVTTVANAAARPSPSNNDNSFKIVLPGAGSRPQQQPQDTEAKKW
jgi:hypothetical protein